MSHISTNVFGVESHIKTQHVDNSSACVDLASHQPGSCRNMLLPLHAYLNTKALMREHCMRRLQQASMSHSPTLATWGCRQRGSISRATDPGEKNACAHLLLPLAARAAARCQASRVRPSTHGRQAASARFPCLGEPASSNGVTRER